MDRNMRLKRTLATLLIFILVLLPLPSYGAATMDQQYVDDILHIIEDNYVEAIDMDKMKDKDVKQIFEQLDDYSEYYTEEEYKDLIANIDGDFVGIGVYLREEAGQILVMDVIPGGPAEMSGISSGDRILTIDGKTATGLGMSEVLELIKGEVGSIVNMRVRSNNAVLIRRVERRRITINPVSFQVIDDIGYIELGRFISSSYKQVQEALDYMDKKGIHKIILDVRNNPGGYLDQAVKISDIFVTDGPIVHIRYKGDKITTYNSRKKTGKYELVVLVNENSASASEILAAAIKDNKSGYIIGSNTFGKGTVQNVMQLPKDDGIKLTIAEYFSPNKSKINGVGVKPDMEVPNIPGEDRQLLAALQLLSAKFAVAQ